MSELLVAHGHSIGAEINTDLQVLNTEKQPIPGLYATGNTSAAIDGASGASMTSEGFRQAVAAALEQAK